MGDTSSEREFLTREEAAAYITRRYFSITPRRLALYAAADKGPAYRLLGIRAFYKPSEIDAWINKPEHYGNVAPPARPGALMAKRA